MKTLLTLLAFIALSIQAAQKPNVVILLVDDMGYGDPKCFNPKSRLKTPAIDRLAREGLMFTDAHAPHSTCIASRYGLLTGRYPLRDNHRFIKPKKITLPKLLKRNGYNTGMSGKWHLGFDDLNPNEWDRKLTGGPVDRGFDTFFGMWASLDWPPYFYVKDRRAVELPTEDIDGYGWWTPDRFYSGKWKPGKIAPNFKHVEATPRFTSEAIRLIDQFANKEKPFFLYFALPSPPWALGAHRGIQELQPNWCLWRFCPAGGSQHRTSAGGTGQKPNHKEYPGHFHLRQWTRLVPKGSSQAQPQFSLELQWNER